MRRFFCDNTACKRRTFVEQVHGLTTRFGRRTMTAQGLVSAVAFALGGRAGARLLLFAVQRSSKLVLCEPESLAVVREVPLADRHGNPEPKPHAGSATLLAVDYDTVVRLNATTLNVEGTWFGQEAAAGTAMFLGELAVRDAPDSVLVARPGSGDVVALDLSTMTPTPLMAGRRPTTRRG